VAEGVKAQAESVYSAGSWRRSELRPAASKTFSIASGAQPVYGFENGRLKVELEVGNPPSRSLTGV
jgi:hypothetical protein